MCETQLFILHFVAVISALTVEGYSERRQAFVLAVYVSRVCHRFLAREECGLTLVFIPRILHALYTFMGNRSAPCMLEKEWKWGLSLRYGWILTTR